MNRIVIFMCVVALLTVAEGASRRPRFPSPPRRRRCEHLKGYSWCLTAYYKCLHDMRREIRLLNKVVTAKPQP